MFTETSVGSMSTKNSAPVVTPPSEEVEIEIVAFAAGLHMLRSDTTPVAARLKSFAQGMPNVKFQACANTMAHMAKKEGKKTPLVANANIVPAGVVHRFEDFTDDFATWGMFYGPEGGE